MCGDSGFDDNIDSILIPHPDRVARQQQTQYHEGAIYLPSLNDVDLADAYVPFDSSTDAAGTTTSDKEDNINSAIFSLLVVGLFFSVIALGEYVANGNAIPPVKAISYQVVR